MGSRELQKEQRRQEILYAGLDLFVTKGYAATKISDLAKKVSMSTGLLFHYFDSKEKLYEELVISGLAATRIPVTVEKGGVIRFFEQFTGQLFEMMQKQPYVARMFVLMAQAQKNEGIPQKIRDIALQVDTIEQFAPVIRMGQEEGTVKEGDALALANAFWCSIQGIAEQYAARPEMGLPRAEWIVDIVRRGPS